MKTLAICLAVFSVVLSGCQDNRPAPEDRGADPALRPGAAESGDEQYNLDGTNVLTQIRDAGAGGPGRDNMIDGATDQDKALAQRVLVAISTLTSGTTGVVSTDQINTNLHVTVRGGVVTLRGTVPSEAQKRAIEQHLQDIEGITRVQNEITVDSSIPGSAPAQEQRGVNR